jgi:hypothetical protein
MGAGNGHKGERGQALILITLSLVATFGLLGLVVDIGWAHFRREAAKTAAQAAASGAAMAASVANGYSCHESDTAAPCRVDWACPDSPVKPPGDSLEAGCLYAKLNGFSNANPRQRVVMSSNISTAAASPAPGTAPTYWVSATVTESLPQLFSSVLGHQWAQVQARSTTGIFLQPKGACIYALDRTASPAIEVTGTADVKATCGVWDNSNSPSALEVKGGGDLTAAAAYVVGKVNDNGGGGALTVTPPGTLKEGADVTPDPFGSIPPPNYPDRCDSNGISGTFTPTMPSDGFYVICGNISLSGNGTQTFPKGTYIVRNGGSISWNNGKVTGAGVTFYMAGSGTSYGSVSVSGNVKVTLTAPTSGLYRGLIFFQDRNAPKSVTNSFTGADKQILDGTLYFPTTSVTYTGGSSATASYTGLIANTITFKGTSYFTADTNGEYTGLGLPQIGILE